MRLIILTTTFPKDKDDFTTPRFVYDLTYNLSEKDITTFVLTPDRPDSELSKEKITDNFIVNRFKYFFKKHQNLTSGEGIIPKLKKSKINYLLIPLLVFRQFFNAVRIIRKNKIDIINSHWLVPSGYIGAIIQRFYKKKNYVTIHAAGLYLLEKIPFGKHFAKYIYKNSKKFFVVSYFGKERFYTLLSEPNLEEFEAKVKVIPMGVYTSKINKNQATRSFNNDKFNILTIGRLVEKKGIKFAIKAMKKLDNNNFYLNVCGDGPLKEELKNLTSELGLNDNIKFHGWITEQDKYDYLHSADLLLVPSIETNKGDKEGLPVVILEALAAGLPIIASDVGGIKDGVINEKTGLLIKEKNVEEIVTAVQRFSNNIEMRKKISENALQHSKNFDWDLISSRYIEEMSIILD